MFFNFDIKDSHCLILDPDIEPQVQDLVQSVVRCYKKRSKGFWTIADPKVPEIWKKNPELFCLQKLSGQANKLWKYAVLLSKENFLETGVQSLKENIIKHFSQETGVSNRLSQPRKVFSSSQQNFLYRLVVSMLMV